MASPTTPLNENPSSPSYNPDPAQTLIDRHQRLKYPYYCSFGDALLQIDEGVFCPTLTKASPLLLEAIDFKHDERVLDVFAGSGAFGINAALRGGSVVTVDISPLAVACTRQNVILNDVCDRIDVREGTMQTCLASDETFDLILANPPLLPGDQTDSLSAAIFDPELTATLNFIDSLPHHLAKSGRCYFLTSDVMDRCGYDVDRLCVKNGLMSSVAAKLDVGYETYRVHKVAWIGGERRSASIHDLII
jgi:methylase of polypeptide subunit release factors